MRFGLIFLATAFLNMNLFAGSASWIQDGGNWSDTNSWNPNTVPNNSSDVATFTDATGSFASANVDSTFSVASLNFTTALSFTLNSGTLNVYNSITVDEATGGANCNTTLFLPNDISIVTDAEFSCNSITGSGGITKTGADVLRVAGTCTYGGTTFINEGIFRSGAEDSFSHSSAIVLANVAGVELNNQGIPNTILSLSGGGSLGGNVTFDNVDAGSLTLGDSNNTTYAGVISGRGEIIKIGTGVFTMTGANTYTEGVTVNAGLLNIQNNTALGSGSASVASGAQLQVQGGITAANALTLNGTGGGTGALANVSGSNTYSGAITLGSATTIGSTSGTLTLSNANAISGTQDLTFVGEGNTTVSGIIATSTGTLTKSGSGTLVLSGANTYSGATSLTAGVLNIQNNTALGSGSVTVQLGVVPQLQLQGGITVANALTLNGESDGSGSFLNVSDSNIWSGAITLGSATTIGSTSGTLTLSNANAISGTQDLTFVGEGNTTVSGIIATSTGTLTKSGGGTLVLSGANTYSGATSLSAGLLNIQNNTALGSGSASVTSGAQLQVQGGITAANAMTLNGEGDGSGALLNVSGSNTCSGAMTLGSATTIGSTSGTLTLSNANAISGTQDLTFVGDGNTTVSGIIATSTGALTKSGFGTLVLSGMNTYTGKTTVSGGRLSVNGQVLGGVTINSGGTLGGAGTVYGGGTIFGKLSPGNSIGTLTFDTSGGDLILDSGSTTNIEIDPTDSSKIVITGGGSVTLGGTVNVIQNAGTYPESKQYSILEGAYTGEFNSTITGGLAGAQFQLSYMSNIVYLLLGATPVSSEISTNHLSGNALVIANNLNQNGSSSTLSLLTSLTESQLPGALNRISPARNAFGSFIAQQTAFSLSQIVMGHLDAFRIGGNASLENAFTTALVADASGYVGISDKSRQSEHRVSAWISGFGEYAHEKASLQNPSFNYLSEGVLIGVDYHENRNLIGGSLGYAHTHYTEDNHFGHGNINAYVAGIYANIFARNFYFSPVIWGIFDEINNTREISFPEFFGKAKANIFAWQLVPHLEVGYDASFSWGNILPFSSVDWAITWQRGYEERGAAPFNATSEAESFSMVQSETGLKFCEKWEYDWGTFFLREKASYIFEKPFGTGSVKTAFIGTPGTFTVQAVNQNLNLGAIGLDFLFVIGKQQPVKVDLAYEGEFGSRYWSNQLNLTVRKDF